MFPGISPEELADLAIRTNGLLPASLLPGSSIRDSIIQCDANVNMSNDFQLIQSQIQLIHDVSGVSDALQGKSPSAGTSASLYAQESFNASYNIRGFLDTFRAFSLRRSRKALQEALPHSSFNTPSFPVSLSFQENTSH
jgi:hypothetical protein